MTRRPDVVHLTTAHPPTDNRIFRKECTVLHEAGVDVHVVATQDADSVVDGIPVHALPRRGGRLARMALGPVDAFRTVRRLRPRVVHIHDPELIPVVALWKVTSRGTAIFDSHEDLGKQVMGKPYLPTWSRPAVATFVRGLEAFADRSFDAIVTATPAIARNFRNRRVVTVQNFPWLRDFPLPTPMPRGGPVRLCYIGGISAGRGSREMVEAVEALPDKAELVLAGPVAPDARSHVEDSSERVDYRGVVAATEIPDMLADTTVGLAVLHPLPNYLESQSTKIFEYMAAGRPFVASDFPSWKQMFSAYDCGALVNPLDVEAISAAVSTIVADPERAAEMGLRGRQAVESVFNFEVEGAKLVALTRDLLQAQKQT